MSIKPDHASSRTPAGPHEAQVWSIALEADPANVASLSACLCSDEHERAARFRRDIDRRRFTVARGALRTILGRALQTDPCRLQFSYGERGKPFLEGLPVQFNLSHSQEVALLAITAGRSVGVDIEAIRPLDDAPRIVSRYFSPQECDEFHRLPPDERPRAFFTGWVRKEAVIKAIGEGLFMALDHFAVPMDPNRPPRLIPLAGWSHHALSWSMHDLSVEPGYVGALVVEGDPVKIHYCQFKHPE